MIESHGEAILLMHSISLSSHCRIATEKSKEPSSYRRTNDDAALIYARIQHMTGR